jgi:hypothetical protein
MTDYDRIVTTVRGWKAEDRLRLIDDIWDDLEGDRLADLASASTEESPAYEAQSTLEGIRRGVEDFAAGRTQPLADAMDDIRRGLGLPGPDESQIREIEWRKASLQNNPGSGLTWDEVQRRIRDRYGR